MEPMLLHHSLPPWCSASPWAQITGVSPPLPKSPKQYAKINFSSFKLFLSDILITGTKTTNTWCLLSTEGITNWPGYVIIWPLPKKPSFSKKKARFSKTWEMSHRNQSHDSFENRTTKDSKDLETLCRQSAEYEQHLCLWGSVFTMPWSLPPTRFHLGH